jgi:single-stranded-DNA-specific exonuclease
MSVRKPKDKKIWISRPFDPDHIGRLAKVAGISPIVAQLLYARGITDPAEIKAFLAPANLARGLYPPETLPGCLDAAEVIVDAIRSDQKITVYGDYDVDGMTATAILVQAIEIVGGRASYFVPNRLDQGYGLSRESIDRLKATGTKLIVTVDCGITSLEEAEYARENGIKLVVTDHHTPVTDPETGELRLPDVEAIVHPLLDKTGFKKCPWPELCGAVVALKLAWALGIAAEGKGEQQVNEQMRMFLVRAIGLAALGTIADVVPLRDENRTIVRFALGKSLQEHLPLGLEYLIEIAGLNVYRKNITSEDIGFSIAPRLNAAGREVLSRESVRDEADAKNRELAKSLLSNPNRLAAAGQMGLASLGVELLITDRPDRARDLAPFINNLNETRQKLERRIMTDALRTIESEYQDASAFVLASHDWHPGVIGIVAGRLAERYHRPVVMIALRANDAGTGSGRGFPIPSLVSTMLSNIVANIWNGSAAMPRQRASESKKRTLCRSVKCSVIMWPGIFRTSHIFRRSRSTANIPFRSSINRRLPKSIGCLRSAKGIRARSSLPTGCRSLARPAESAPKCG